MQTLVAGLLLLFAVAVSLLNFDFVKKFGISKLDGLASWRIGRDQKNSNKKLQQKVLGIKKSGFSSIITVTNKKLILAHGLTMLNTSNVTTIFILLAILIFVVMTILRFSLVLVVILAPSVAIFTYGAIVAFSRQKMISKDLKVMDAIDLISNSVDQNILGAVSDVETGIDPSIADYFKEFTRRVQYQNMMVKESLNVLNEALGPISDSFIEKCIMFDSSGARGMSEIFIEEVRNNMDIRILMAKMNKAVEKKSNEIYGSWVATVVFYTYIAGGMAKDVVNQPMGQILSAIALSFILISFTVFHVISINMDFRKALKGAAVE